jgi:hypothetical protein
MTKLSLPVGSAGQKNRGFGNGHDGIDYGWYNADPAGSQRTFAAAPGTVTSVTNTSGWGSGWGSRIVIAHAPGVQTTYNHYWVNGIRVVRGQKVVAGTYLGQMGSTGDSDGTHLHFELYINGARVNPDPYFTKDLPGTSAPMFKDQRKTANTNAVQRAEPTTKSAKLGLLDPSTIYTMKYWAAGESISGLNLWYGDRSTPTRWMHCSSFLTPHVTTGLTKWTAPKPPAVPVPEAPPVVVEPEPEPEPEPEAPPVVVEPEPEAPPVVVEPEPEAPPVVVEPEPEPETPPVVVEPEPEPEPTSGLAVGITAAVMAIIAAIIAFFSR